MTKIKNSGDSTWVGKYGEKEEYSSIVGKYGEKEEYSSIVGGTANWYNHSGNQSGGFYKY